jgi:hypothetical protein
MNFEDLQKTWQTQAPGATVTINADLLLREVRHNQRHFWSVIFWRDAREVVVCVLLVAFFGWRARRDHDWTLYLLALAALSVGSFMVADRVRQRRKSPLASDSLKGCVESSLAQVNHQIWLLKNIFWWYLLPFVAALGVSLCVSAWRSWQQRFNASFGLGLAAGICALIIWGVYKLNQYAVRKGLEPRRRELEALRAGLGKED